MISALHSQTWLLFSVLALATSETITVSPDGAASPQEPDLFRASTWAPLNAVARADLFVAAAEAGKLGENNYDLIPAAQLVEAGEFQYGNQLVRGAKAISDIPASVFCVIGEDALISLASVVRSLDRRYSDRAALSVEIRAIAGLVTAPADERALLTLLLLREASRTSSPLMPYMMSFLRSAHEHIPSAWDPATAEGASRRRGIIALDGGATLLTAADEIRKVMSENYAALVPRALEKLPHLLGVTGPDQVDVTELYTFQRFAEIWLAIRSRSFQNGAHGVLVPLACLMNHPAEGEESNVEIQVGSDGGMVLKATRHIKRGDQLTYSYGADLLAERALLVYGFPKAVWLRMPRIEGFYSS